jgi:putative methylase
MGMICSRRELEMLLERVESFSDPKLRLEQYRLPAPVAAEVLWYIGLRHKDLEGRIVADLGCGTGMLTAGAALMGADYTIGVDIDTNAISSARRMVTRLGLGGRVDLINCSVEQLPISADVVIQNPPFGVRVKGADRAFLKAGLEAAGVVYSIHKADDGVRRFVAAYVKGEGGKVDEILPLSIKLPPTYHFHTKRVHEFAVDLYRIVRVSS